MGYLGVFSALLAEAYYAVFGGWMMYYIVMSFGPLAHMADAGEVGAFFGSFISSPMWPAGWRTDFPHPDDHHRGRRHQGRH